MVTIKRTTSLDPHFKGLAEDLNADLWLRYPETQHLYEEHNVIENNRTAVIAYQDDRPVGIACFKSFSKDTVEIKRMFVRPEHRGKGIASQLLKSLEDWAKEARFTNVILETGIRQPEAIGLYKKLGYAEIDNYPPYVGMEESLCMGKTLV